MRHLPRSARAPRLATAALALAGVARAPTAAAILALASMTVATPAAPAAQVPLPPAHESALPGASGPPPGPASPGAAAARLVFDLPAGWVSEPPSSSMRLAQARVPGRAGAAQFAIFYFGPGGGGTPEANIERWIGQIDKPAGPPQRGSLSTHGLAVTWVEVAGTMKATAAGMGPATAQPGTRLLGAVVEGRGGPWFAKLTGPDATVAAARPAFLALLRGLRTAGP
jgi:hypothetical protein